MKGLRFTSVGNLEVYYPDVTKIYLQQSEDDLTTTKIIEIGNGSEWYRTKEPFVSLVKRIEECQ